MRPLIVAALVLQLALLHAPDASAMDFSGVRDCSDVDELPAYGDEPWASLYEVIAPVRDLCKVPVPPEYTIREPWPESLFALPKGNVPKAMEWEEKGIKADQSWLKINGDKVELPRDGGSLAASKFLKALPSEVRLDTVRTVLDEGAGVCGLAAEIMSTHLNSAVVLSYAPHDGHQNQVQLCMERGVPAIIFSMSRYQFPVPPAAFDMVTCKWCWHWIGATGIGQWFLEVDRVLRPGGWFVIYAGVWKNYNFADQVNFWSASLGWKKVKGGKGDLVAFQKPDKIPGLPLAYVTCPEWETKQPSFRRFHVPCRHSVQYLVAKTLDELQVQRDRLLVEQIIKLAPRFSTFTNILDANSMGGSIGKAIKELLPHAWTFNIQPVHSTEYHHHSPTQPLVKLQGNYASVSNYMAAAGTDELETVFESGQIGLYHDWCYMFPGYPRIFDVIFIRDVELSSAACLEAATLEFDRLLRPGGLIVFSGVKGLVSHVTEATISSLGWKLVSDGSNMQTEDYTNVILKLGGRFADVDSSLGR